MQIKENHLGMLLDIISKYPYDFYAFGSRTKGTAHKNSDLDICIKGGAPLSVLAEINEHLENSNIPYKVDLVLYEHMQADFKDLVEKDFVRINS